MTIDPQKRLELFTFFVLMLVAWVGRAFFDAVVLAGVVANILLTPSGALATVPLAARLAAMAIGLAAYFALRKSVIMAVIAGEAAIIGFAWWFGP
jgi:hypothetical protein